MPTGPDLLAGMSTLPMVWSRQCQGILSITDTLIEVGPLVLGSLRILQQYVRSELFC
jgi:hypothetical protein